MQDSRGLSYWLTWAAAALRRSQDEPEATTLARELGVSARTVRRWQAVGDAPRWVVRVLMMLADGIPTTAGAEWQEWRFVRRPNGVTLCGPDGSAWSPIALLDYRRTVDRARHLAEHLAPGAQLEWRPPSAGRTVWPGDVVPTWQQLEEALRRVIDDQAHRSRL